MKPSPVNIDLSLFGQEAKRNFAQAKNKESNKPRWELQIRWICRTSCVFVHLFKKRMHRQRFRCKALSDVDAVEARARFANVLELLQRHPEAAGREMVRHMRAVFQNPVHHVLRHADAVAADPHSQKAHQDSLKNGI
jgi:hypothetical protein